MLKHALSLSTTYSQYTAAEANHTLASSYWVGVHCVLLEPCDERCGVKGYTFIAATKTPYSEKDVHTLFISRWWRGHQQIFRLPREKSVSLSCLRLSPGAVSNVPSVLSAQLASPDPKSVQQADLHLASERCLWLPSFSVISCILKRTVWFRPVMSFPLRCCSVFIRLGAEANWGSLWP